MDDVAELQKTKIKGKGHLQASLLSPADWVAPAKSGWISKEGANRKSVKKRWFVMQGSKMIYFKSQEVNAKSKPIGFFILEAGSKVALMPREVKDKSPPFKWRVLTPSRTWEFTNETEEEMKGWVRMIARIVNPELTFGMPLTTIVARCKRRGSASDVPVIVNTLIQFLRENDGVNVEGIFRMSGDQNSIKQVKSRFNTEIDTSIVIPKDTDVHVVTGTLKYFLRELESPLIPISSNPLLRAILGLNGPKEKAIGFRKLIEGLPRENAATLQFILKYLHQVATNHTTNLMTTQNLAVVFGPCFIRSEPNAVAFQDADMQLNSVNSMIEQYQVIFPNEDLIASVGCTTGAGSGSVSGSAAGSTFGSNAPAYAPAPASLPPSFNPPPPNRIPPNPASVAFRPAGPAANNSRENMIVIGGHTAPSPGGAGSPTTTNTSAGAGALPNAVTGAPPPSYLPPLPATTNGEANGNDQEKFRGALTASRPPAFAPPSLPPSTSPSGTSGSPLSGTLPYGSTGSPTDSIVSAGSDSAANSFVSIYDDSSSDDELEVVSSSAVDESPIVVTSLDDITDLEGEDGSIDVSKFFAKPLNVLPASVKPRSGGVWTTISKPTAQGEASPTSPTETTPRGDSGLLATPATVSPPSSIPAPTSSLNSSTNSAPTSARASVPPGADEITLWLASLGEEFVGYAPILTGEGFKTVLQLSDINDDDLKELGVKMAHRKAMRAAIDKIKASP